MPDAATTSQTADLKQAALDYHRFPTPGKLEVVATKSLANQRDLALAYSPGVAAACEAIVADPAEVATVTARANLVAVVTNGTAALGLGPHPVRGCQARARQDAVGDSAGAGEPRGLGSH